MIRRFMVGALILITNMNVFSAEVDFVYVDSRLSQSGVAIHDGPIRAVPRTGIAISIDSFHDFIDLAERYSVEVMFRESTTIRGTSGEVVNFFFPHSGTIYSFSVENYETLADLRDGLENGFEDGRAFYHARQLGANNAAEYERLYQSGFIRNEDRLRYLNTRSTLQRNVGEYVALPRHMSESDFRGDFLRIMVRQLIRNGYAPPRTSEAYQTLNDRGMLTTDPIVRRNDQGRIVSRSSGTIVRPDLPFFDLEYAVNAVHAHLTEQLQQDWVRSGADELSRLSLPPYWIVEGGGYEIVAEKSAIWWGDVPEGVLYYFANWTDSADISSYLDYRDAIVAGFHSVEDRDRGRARGFEKGADYYDAHYRGFDTFLHYDAARTMNLLDVERYEPYRELMQRLTTIKDRFGLGNYRDALLIDNFSRLETGRTISLQRIVETTNADIRQYPAIRRMGTGWSEISQRTVDFLVNQHPDVFEGIGYINTVDAVFTRR